MKYLLLQNLWLARVKLKIDKGTLHKEKQMKIRVLIVDDEYPAREEIRYQLTRYDDVEVVGEAASVSEAIALISAVEYDLVFLDINFPVRNGIDLGREIREMECDPFIIYVTAHQEYALQAFKVQALDYILKPIDPKEFDKAINRVKRMMQIKAQGGVPAAEEGGEEQGEYKGQWITKISAEVNGKIHLVDLDDIFYAFVDNNIVYIKRGSDTLMTKYTLSSLEDKLDKLSFFRVSRSHLVNLNKIKQILPFFKGSCYLIMSDKEESEVPVSRRQAKELKKIFDF